MNSKDSTGFIPPSPIRTVPAKFDSGHRSYKTVINGIEPDSRLHLLLDNNFKPVSLPPSGIVLTDYLGKILGVKAGDMLTVEVLEGSKPIRQVPVVALVKQYLGVTGYMDITALNRLMRRGRCHIRRISGDGFPVSGETLSAFCRNAARFRNRRQKR